MNVLYQSIIEEKSESKMRWGEEIGGISTMVLRINTHAAERRKKRTNFPPLASQLVVLQDPAFLHQALLEVAVKPQELNPPAPELHQSLGLRLL